MEGSRMVSKRFFHGCPMCSMGFLWFSYVLSRWFSYVFHCFPVFLRLFEVIVGVLFLYIYVSLPM